MTDAEVCRHIERRLADRLLPVLADIAEEGMAFRVGRPKALVDEICRATGVTDSHHLWLAIARHRAGAQRRAGG
jgi:hypothetical protein